MARDMAICPACGRKYAWSRSLRACRHCTDIGVRRQMRRPINKAAVVLAVRAMERQVLGLASWVDKQEPAKQAEARSKQEQKASEIYEGLIDLCEHLGYPDMREWEERKTGRAGALRRIRKGISGPGGKRALKQLIRFVHEAMKANEAMGPFPRGILPIRHATRLPSEVKKKAATKRAATRSANLAARKAAERVYLEQRIQSRLRGK